MMEDRGNKAVLEVLLFLSGEPITLPSIKDVTELPESEIKRLMDELIAQYKERNTGLLIVE
ncbi:MAG: SMC-Scp complex subunit ScpB, partial [Nitrospirae bacterium]|nr:SMC-Scp complex subunit ScpB [Nitrospirota bacterium]